MFQVGDGGVIGIDSADEKFERLSRRQVKDRYDRRNGPFSPLHGSNGLIHPGLAYNFGVKGSSEVQVVMIRRLVTVRCDCRAYQ
jgi:hypothetical protein